MSLKYFNDSVLSFGWSRGHFHPLAVPLLPLILHMNRQTLVSGEAILNSFKCPHDESHVVAIGRCSTGDGRWKYRPEVEVERKQMGTNLWTGCLPNRVN